MIRILVLTVTLGLLVSPARATDIRNNTPYQIQICCAFDKDDSISGIGNNGRSDPNQGLRCTGYYRLKPGGTLNNVTASYVLVQIFHGQSLLELSPTDVVSGTPGRTFMISKNGDGFKIAVRFSDPTTSGRNEEGRRAAAIRRAGYDPKVFVRLPANGAIALTNVGKARIEDFLSRNSVASVTKFRLINKTPNEYRFEVNYRDSGGAGCVFDDKPSVRRNGFHTWVTDQPINIDNGTLPIGVRASDPFTSDGFKYWGMRDDGTIVGLTSFDTRHTFDQAAGSRVTIYEFGLKP